MVTSDQTTLPTPEEIDKHIGARLRFFRLHRGVSQTALADQVGVSFQQLQKYERGANRISARDLFVFARTLDVPVGEFFLGGKDASQQPSGDPPPWLTRPELDLLKALKRIENVRSRKQVAIAFLTAITAMTATISKPVPRSDSAG
jgi:transcriptional regulator with XRE-family HTH domain